MVPALAPDPLPLGRTDAGSTVAGRPVAWLPFAGRAEVPPLIDELFTDELPTQQVPDRHRPPAELPTTVISSELPTTVISPVTGPRSADRPLGPPRRSGRRSRLPWIAAALVAVVVVVALIVVARTKHSLGPVAAARSAAAAASASNGASQSGPSSQSRSGSQSGPSGSGSPSGSAGQQQAAAIAGYLSQSSAVRPGISAAIGAIGGCRNIAAAVTTLRQAADVRTRIASSLAPAQVNALPDGEAIRTELRQAMTASAEADRHYAAWGEAVATSCAGQAAHTPEFADAQRSDAVASAAKQRFVQSWNAVAPAFGFPPQSPDSI